MNPKVQRQVDKFKQVTTPSGAGHGCVSRPVTQRQDGLSMAIRSKSDADDFMLDLKAAVAKAKSK